MTETKLAIDIAADISARPEFAKCESPLVLAIVQAALAAHDSAGAQPESVADGYKQIGWVHPVYLDDYLAQPPAIEVSPMRLSKAQVPVFVQAAAPQPSAKDGK